MVLGVARSGYYRWRKNPFSKRNESKDKQTDEIRQIHEQSRKTYGSRRISAKLRKDGNAMSKNTVAKRMREAGLSTVYKRKYKATTNSKHKYAIHENLIKGHEVTKSNEVWVSDITYIGTKEGWLYLAAIVDLKTKDVVGYCMSERMTKELVINALKRAAVRYNPKEGLIVHSDRGSQYASDEYQELLKTNKFKCSMSAKGNPYENAAMESFNGTIKMELIYPNGIYETREDAKMDVFEYVETFYNRKRLHSSIGYMSPEEYRNILAS